MEAEFIYLDLARIKIIICTHIALTEFNELLKVPTLVEEVRFDMR